MPRSKPSAAKAKQSDYRRIADGLRGQILGGKLAPGTRLPSMGALAATWETSFGTMHNALEALGKEGWVERVHGAGTFVADFKTRFVCAGLYYARNIFSDEQSAFSRTLHTALISRLAVQGKEVMVFVDSRPENRQASLDPVLADALARRRVQCVIGAALNNVADRAMGKLSVPTAFTSHGTSSHRVTFGFQSLIGDGVSCLARLGCRSVGLISNFRVPINPQIPDFDNDFYPLFRRSVAAAGLSTREDWMSKPLEQVTEFELFGYREFKRLWALAEKPEGIIVTPDLAARGVILAVLEAGIEKVTSRMKFVMHRNSHARLLCPFDATWAITDEDAMARELVRMIQRQFDGEKVVPVVLQHQFKHEKGTR
jgi:DNA-binding transcriptional regulator YhcF (GntR family)